METKYATILDRVKAATIDAIVLIAMMYVASEIFSLFETIPNYIRIIVSVFVFILYEPILVSIYGGTIGHSFSKILVKQEDNSNKNLLFHIAIIRFFFKVLLGWVSLLTVTGNEKKKAIHDFIVKSIVLVEVATSTE